LKDRNKESFLLLGIMLIKEKKLKRNFSKTKGNVHCNGSCQWALAITNMIANVPGSVLTQPRGWG